jgi:hypothetical protein
MAHLIHALGTRPIQSYISPFVPTQVPGLQMWLDGADPLATGVAPTAGATVTTWVDKSGQSYSGTGVNNPTFVSGGGISFNGTNQYYTTTYTAAPTQETGFVIFSSTNPSALTNKGMIGNNAANGSRGIMIFGSSVFLQLQGIGNVMSGAANIAANTSYVHDYTYISGGTSASFLNGSLYGSNSTSSATYGSGLTYIGYYTGPVYFSGTIQEILIFNTILTTNQRQAIEGYLAWKWSLQGTLPVAHPYSTAAPNASSLTNLFSPLQVPGAAAWYDATDPYGTGAQPPTGTSITSWTDKSGNGRTLTKFPSYNAPTYTQAAINTLPTIDFTNASGMYTATSFAKSSNVTMLLVCIPKSGLVNYATFWGHYTNLDNDIQLRNNGTQTLMTWHTNGQNSLGTTIVLNSPTMYSCTMAGGTAMFMQQTNTSGTTSFTNTETLTWTAGAAPEYVGADSVGNKTNSYIGEVLYYQTVLSVTQRRVLEGYLAWKWGLQSYLPNTHPYYTSPPTQSSLPTSFLPTQIPNLQGWYDAADPNATGIVPANGTTVTTWSDKSGNSRTLGQSGSYALPTLTTNYINSLPSVNFTNTSGLITSAFAKSSNVSVFVVGNILAAPTAYYGTIWGHFVNHDNDIQLRRNANTMAISWHTNNDNNNTLLTAVSGSPVLYSCTMTNGTGMFMQQTTSTGTTTVSSTQSLSWTAGSASVYVGLSEGGEPIQSYISEIVYYQSVLTTGQRQAVEGYLAWKWGLQINLPSNHPFRYFAPVYSSVQALTTYVYKPSYLPGLQAWYDANDPYGTAVQPANSAVMSNWVDKSGNSNTMVARGAPTYTTASQNSLPGITLSGNSGTAMTMFYQAAIPPGTFFNEMDTFIVYKCVTSVTYNAIFSRNLTSANSNLSNPIDINGTVINVGANNAANYSSSYNIYNTNTSLYNFNVSQATTATSKITGYTNGTAMTLTFTGGSSTWAPSDNGNVLCLGGRADAFTGMNGLFYEVMVFNFPLSTGQRQFVEGYLAWKWGLFASLPTAHPYYAAAPNINTLFFQPTQIVGLNLWLDINDPLNNGTVPSAGTAISTWYDKSPLVNNAVNSTGPAVNLSNDGRNYMGFVGNTKYNLTPITAMLSNYFTVFAVETCTNNQWLLAPQNYTGGGATPNSIWIKQNLVQVYNTSYYQLTPAYDSAVDHVWSFSFTSLPQAYSFAVYLNGTYSAPQSNAAVTWSGFLALNPTAVIGNTGWDNINSGYSGKIRELLIYQGNILTADRQVIEGYLAWKWNLQSSLPTNHPYSSVVPSLLTFIPSYTGTSNISCNAASYLPLYSNAIDVGFSPQTVTVNGTVSYSNLLGKSCIYFNNSTANYLSFPMLSLSGMTVAFWFNTASAAYYTPAAFTTASYSSSINFDIINSTTLTTYVALPNNSPWTLSVANTIPGPNVWNFVTMTVNQNSFVETTYINGSNQTTGTGTAAFSLSPTTFILGKSGDNTRAYQGFIQNFMYFNTILTGAQINALYEQTSTDLAVPSIPPTITLTYTNPTLSVSWSASANTTSYRVQFYGVSSSVTTGGSLTQVFTTTGTTQAFTGTPSASYFYATVTGVNSGVLGSPATSSAVLIQQAPSAPTNVTMGSFAAQQTTISTSWTAVSGATSYTVNFLSNASNSTSGGTVWQTFTGVTGTSQTSSSALVSGATGKYYYSTVTAVNGAGSSSASASSGTVRYFIPLWIPNISLWLDGSDVNGTGTSPGNGTTFTTWTDKSGNSRNATFSGTMTVTTNSQNSLAGVTVASTATGQASAPTSTFISAFVYFAVYKGSTNPGNFSIVNRLVYPSNVSFLNFYNTSRTLPGLTGTSGQSYTSGYNLFNTTVSLYSFNLDQVAKTCTEYSNGTLVTNPAISNFTAADNGTAFILIATRSDGALRFAGLLYDLIVINVALSTTNRQILEGWLAWKWGLQGSLPGAHPYKNASP